MTSIILACAIDVPGLALVSMGIGRLPKQWAAWRVGDESFLSSKIPAMLASEQDSEVQPTRARDRSAENFKTAH